MYCHRCGNRLPNEAVFCNSCGTKVLLNDQDIPQPPPLGKVTVQFGDSSPMTPPELSSGPPYSAPQFGDNFRMTPPQFSSPPYPPTQFGDSSPMTPPQFSSPPYPQYPANWQVPTAPLAQEAASSST